jgi:pimeloyl-ACP methyl ester carboxylesterase
MPDPDAKDRAMSTTTTGPPPPVTENDIRTTTVDDGAAEYLDLGTGPVVVLVHGDGETARDWRWIAPAVAAAGHRVIAPSLPGHGATAEAPSYAMEDLARWLGRFLDAVGIDSATVGGNSIGGLIPIHLALQQPDRVSRLLLIDSAGLGNAVNPVLGLETVPVLGEAAVGLVFLPGGPQLRSAVRAQNLFAQPLRVPPEWWLDQLRWGGGKPMLTASLACKPAILDAAGQFHLVLDRLPELTVPTLIMWGALDKVVPIVHGQAAARLLPDCRLEVLPTSGHVPHVETPDAVLVPLLRFLRDTRSAA